MLSARATQLAVWGDPIAHSRSPQLHAAAYRVLGVDWTYGRRRVDAAGFAAALAERDDTWRGLSLTFPLKAAAFAAADERDTAADLTGAANTLLFAADGIRAFNTDVGGIIDAARDLEVDAVDSARIVGAGATATSALVALAELGVTEVDVVARRREQADRLRRLGVRLGVAVQTSPPAADHAPVGLTVATLPGDAPIDPAFADRLAAGGVLFDVVYGTWPTALAAAWTRAGLRAVDGSGMLVRQALRQVRVFFGLAPDEPLPSEDTVLAGMRAALMGD